MKFLIVLALLLSLAQIEASGGVEKMLRTQGNWLQRLSHAHPSILKITYGGIMVATCTYLSSCMQPYYNPDQEPPAAVAATSSATEEAMSATTEEAMPLAVAPPEDFRPAGTANPHAIKIRYPKGFGGISHDQIDTYVTAKDELLPVFYNNVLLHYQRDGSNFLGIGQANKGDEYMVQVLDPETRELREVIDMSLVKGIYVHSHNDYGDHFVKFPSIHMQKIAGERFAFLDQETVYGKVRVVLSNNYRGVLIHGVQKSSDTFVPLTKESRFWVLVQRDHLTELDNN